MRMLKAISQILLTGIFLVPLIQAEEQAIDPASARVLAQLEHYCKEIPNHLDLFANNLEDGSVRSMEVELEPGVVKHDILIKVSFDDSENYISCYQNFKTPLQDKSLHELRNGTSEIEMGDIACVDKTISADPGAELTALISGVQKATEQAACEEESKSSLGNCTKNMAYCGLENLKLTKVLKIDKPADANCSGLLKGAGSTYADFGQCMATFIRGAFNEITDTLKFLVVEAPVWLYKKTFGRWFGEPAVEQMENVESLEAIAASASTDKEIEEEQKNPKKSFFEKVVAFTENLILEQGVKNFGCEKWSSGIPGVGTCLNPPASWECASCKQKAMALCGVAGYATGMVVETAALATPVGVVAGTVAGLARMNKAAKAAKLGKEISTASRLAANLASGGRKVAKLALAPIAPIAKAGFSVGKGVVKLLKLIPGVELTAKVLSAPIRGFFKVDDFLTSKAWSFSFHGSKAYTQVLAKTGDVSKALAAAKTASKVSQTQKVGSHLLQVQSEIRLEAKNAADPALSSAKRAEAAKRQEKLMASMRRQQEDYTKLRSSISSQELEAAKGAPDDYVVELMNKFKSQDEQIIADMYKYGVKHVQKVETLLPSGGVILSMNKEKRIIVEIPAGNQHRDYLMTIQKVADDAKIDNVDALRQLAYMPSDQLHKFKETYPQFNDPILSLSKIYNEKYAKQLIAVTDPIDKDNLIKLIRELELRQKNTSEISSKLDEILGTCSI